MMKKFISLLIILQIVASSQIHQRNAIKNADCSSSLSAMDTCSFQEAEKEGDPCNFGRGTCEIQSKCAFGFERGHCPGRFYCCNHKTYEQELSQRECQDKCYAYCDLPFPQQKECERFVAPLVKHYCLTSVVESLGLHANTSSHSICEKRVFDNKPSNWKEAECAHVCKGSTRTGSSRRDVTYQDDACPKCLGNVCRAHCVSSSPYNPTDEYSRLLKGASKDYSSCVKDVRAGLGSCVERCHRACQVLKTLPSLVAPVRPNINNNVDKFGAIKFEYSGSGDNEVVAMSARSRGGSYISVHPDYLGNRYSIQIAACALGGFYSSDDRSSCKRGAEIWSRLTDSNTFAPSQEVICYDRCKSIYSGTRRGRESCRHGCMVGKTRPYMHSAVTRGIIADWPKDLASDY